GRGGGVGGKTGGWRGGRWYLGPRGGGGGWGGGAAKSPGGDGDRPATTGGRAEIGRTGWRRRPRICWRGCPRGRARPAARAVRRAGCPASSCPVGPARGSEKKRAGAWTKPSHPNS